MHSFRYFTSINELLPPPPLPHINVENDIFYVGKVYAARIINIAIVGRREIIMDVRVSDFQNIFAHDCSLNFAQWVKDCEALTRDLTLAFFLTR